MPLAEKEIEIIEARLSLPLMLHTLPAHWPLFQFFLHLTNLDHLVYIPLDYRSSLRLLSIMKGRSALPTIGRKSDLNYRYRPSGLKTSISDKLPLQSKERTMKLEIWNMNYPAVHRFQLLLSIKNSK
ncbi:hypothetical protein ACTXT7_006277 [Hymenolepis weldensis]